jgi:U3 small nucleolar RNA-associated protein 22
VPFPSPQPAEDSPYKVSFSTPSNFNVVGSYVTRTMVRSQPALAVDMVVVMPSDMCQEKDFLHLRYFYKRAYFLAVLASSIRQEVGGKAVKFGHLLDNPLLPMLVVDVAAAENERSGDKHNGAKKSSDIAKASCTINVIPCIEETLFPPKKLAASRSCLRPKSESADGVSAEPSPFYNATVIAEGRYASYLRLLRTAGRDCPSFNDACILGRIWLTQRGLGGSMAKGGFGTHEWAVVLASLLQHGGKKGQGALSKSWSAPQLFKAVVQYLATTDLSKKPHVLGPKQEDAALDSDCGPVLYDTARHLNIAFKMSFSSAALLRQHAKWTHRLLREESADQFTSTFILRIDVPLQMCDLVLQISGLELGRSAHQTDARSAVWDYAQTAHRTLKKAFGNRAKLIHLEMPEGSTWKLHANGDGGKPTSIVIGVALDAENASRQVDHGPPVEAGEKAKEFQRFWGDKAELRRFKDGSILESLVWTQDSALDICEEITRYILKRHLKVDVAHGHLHVYAKSFRSILPLKTSDVAAFNKIRKTFDTLEQDIRGLDDLPLHIRQIVPTSAALRYSTVRLPDESQFNALAQPWEATISFEASGKWPDNLQAIQQTKAALLLRIVELLQAAHSKYKVHVGLEDPPSILGNTVFLDIVHGYGITFRLRIQSDLEDVLLEQRTQNKALPQHLRTESARLLSAIKYQHATLPLHTQTVATLCTRFPALSGTLRLLKHWFSAHKLACHVTEEFVELLAMRTFLEPYPWDAPASATSGFLRTIAWLSRWDWRAEPLIIDTSGEMLATTRSAVATRLEAWRKLDPSMNHTVLVVATTHDASGTAYTPTAKPSKVVAARMTNLARSAMQLAKNEGVELEAKALFTPSLKEYDVLIYLSASLFKATMHVYIDEDMAANGGKPRHSKFKNLDARLAKTPLPVTAAPVSSLLEQLSTAFDGPILFFHGGDEDRVIGGIWSPLLDKRAFKTRMPGSYRPAKEAGAHVSGREADYEDGSEADEEEETTELNKEAVLAEIARIGGDLIERIEVRDR